MFDEIGSYQRFWGRIWLPFVAIGFCLGLVFGSVLGIAASRIFS